MPPGVRGLGLRPVDLVRGEGGWSARIVGKGRKPGQVALSPSLVANLQAYAYQLDLPRDARLFPVSRMRVHQVVSDAFQAAGIAKPDHVGAVHVLRHSGAIARLEQTGNPKALQDHLRHADARMTLRYRVEYERPATMPQKVLEKLAPYRRAAEVGVNVRVVFVCETRAAEKLFQDLGEGVQLLTSTLGDVIEGPVIGPETVWRHRGGGVALY